MDEEAEPDELPAESGSFFNFFEIESDPFDVSVANVPLSPWLTGIMYLDWYAHR